SLAQWCEDEKLPGPMKLEAQAIVDLDPDCEDARAMLGQVSVDGRWMREAAAKSARGEVKIGGVWYPAAEAERRLASRRRARALASLERRINRRLQDLFSSSETASRKAHDQLMSIAREERLGELADLTSRWYDQAQTWRSQGGGTIIEVRAERAQITAMRERSLSLGGGAGSVRVQLPELRRTRVATTVVF
ncbi:MAG: hypothetical protein KDB53_15590, partial [Planctomycetes bacterium]|nr:hypothetical protein [Planctomycetota bacterium]